MKTKKHKLLKKIRSKAGMSVTRAANFALVDPRTWRCWETEEDNETARSPKAAALWSFFARSGLPEPVTQMEHSPRGQVLSIASAKGGVGKTPITINVAASMVEKGFKVAIVTHDLVYRFAHDDGQQPAPGTLVSKIDFYDELDLITFTDAVKHRRKDMRQHLASLPPHEQELYRAHHAVELRALERKQHATEKLSELITRYDYVLIDMNGATELIRRFADVVAVVIDTKCTMSVRAAERFVSDLREIKCRKTTPGYFGLLTNYDVGGVSFELEEFVCDHMTLSEAQIEQLQFARHRNCKAREHLLEKIDALDFPLLHTELTKAYDIATEMYETNPANPQECDYFDSLLDYAPKSHAAREIRRLTEELIKWRL
ncbi:ParA family protein [Pseudomonas pudica]|uniref:ParA family protein n=1 Tax=Pseudomonas pudica TaxID=272772 RepID=A0ABS0FW60_9PSED|nr:ParA family protein [Pseudomonas pudica]MBF8644593.1 ParA family protein [Pseudomonas pudica]MBF8759686.1 ParA family protein [Pseudomonas pudica]